MLEHITVLDDAGFLPKPKGQRVKGKARCREQESSLSLARRTGAPFYLQLIRGLKAAPVGPERTQLCQLRRNEVREALAFVLGVIATAEGSFSSSNNCSLEQLQRLGSTVTEVRAVCHRLDHAIEILEANSRACSEDCEVMSEYTELYSTVAECNFRTFHLYHKVRSLEEKVLSASFWVGCPCVGRPGAVVPVLPLELPAPQPEEVEEEQHGGKTKGPVAADNSKRALIKLASKAANGVPDSVDILDGTYPLAIKVSNFGGVFSCLIWLVS